MFWDQLYEIALKDGFYEINHGSTKNIVLFGNCHVSAIGFYLDSLLEHQYNIYIVISYRDRDQPFTTDEKKKIWTLIEDSDYFIYQQHYSDFSINASTIEQFAKKEKYLIPNMILNFTDNESHPIDDSTLKSYFVWSLSRLESSIKDSDFPNFSFILENFRKIRFFNIPGHPTHYVLYLLSVQIFYLINKSDYKLTIDDYYGRKNDSVFIANNKVSLPGFYEYKPHECQLLEIDIESEYFDIV